MVPKILKVILSEQIWKIRVFRHECYEHVSMCWMLEWASTVLNRWENILMGGGTTYVKMAPTT
ncbi:hypothetical protein PILCRDRAFT_559453 [Piloderma croceum F 1598]|uniref:Uncharacterized protein n=1 Tax=Piloderma croceum (strain F 1598) TaxID=765440 RepID=A0A0C3F450_PILCF|nr:hypothetical protein PILCRDRAFT_559453 [Piloderma croceum F 1598]